MNIQPPQEQVLPTQCIKFRLTLALFYRRSRSLVARAERTVEERLLLLLVHFVRAHGRRRADLAAEVLDRVSHALAEAIEAAHPHVEHEAPRAHVARLFLHPRDRARVLVLLQDP